MQRVTVDQALQIFLDSKCEVSASAKIRASDFVAAYNKWAEGQWKAGEMTAAFASTTMIGKKMAALGVGRLKSNGLVYYLGVQPAEPTVAPNASQG